MPPKPWKLVPGKVENRPGEVLEGEEGAPEIHSFRLDEPESEGPACDETSDEGEDDDGEPDREAKCKEQQQALAEFYAAHPEFYDKTRDDYKDHRKKDKLLQHKAKELGITVKDITSWYVTARSTFGRIMKQKSGQSVSNMTPRQRWLWQNCQFFRQYIVHRTVPTTSLAQVPQPPSWSQSHIDDDEAESNDEDDAHAGPFAAGSASIMHIPISQVPRKKKNQAQGLQHQARVEEALAPMDEVDAWVRWMSLALRSLPRPLWREFCDESYTLVRRYVRQADAQQSSQQQQQHSPLTQYAHHQPFQPYQQQQMPTSIAFPTSQGNLQTSRPVSAPRFTQWDNQDLNMPVVLDCLSSRQQPSPESITIKPEAGILQ